MADENSEASETVKHQTNIYFFMWLEEKISLYECAADNTGRVTTFRDVLLTQFGVPHKYYYKTYPEDKAAYSKGKWINGTANDLHTIIKLRNENLSSNEKTLLKQTMQCYTPAAVLKTKKQGAIEEANRTGIMQLDFDYKDISEYDVEELKQCVFSLDCVAFCGLSCSGTGFYALVLIAEPYRLKEYAEHCYEALLQDGIKADTSKGRNVNDLRFVSWDGNMLIRPNPKPLQIKNFKSTKKSIPVINNVQLIPKTCDGFVNSQLRKIQSAQVGNRFPTVQKVAYTLGGLGDSNLLQNIIDVINTSAAFTNEEMKYCKCAEDCFRAGVSEPLLVNK